MMKGNVGDKAKEPSLKMNGRKQHLCRCLHSHSFAAVLCVSAAEVYCSLRVILTAVRMRCECVWSLASSSGYDAPL